MSISRRGAIALLALAVATGLTLLHDGTTQAQVQLIDKEQLRSGGAVEPDLSVLTPGPGSRTGKGSPPRVGPNVQANDPQLPLPDGLLGRSETTIASNNGGTHMVAGWNDADGFCGPPFGAPCPPPPVPGLSGYSYSTDGGQTWFDGGAPPVFDGAMTRGDPWLDLGGHGNDTYFYANLAVNATDGGSRGVIVHRGSFAGNTLIWYDGQVFDSPRNAVTPGADFYDKEALAAAKDGSGAAYVTLTNFQETCGIAQWGYGTIEVWRTQDGGETWEGPAIAGPDESFILDPSQPLCGYEGVLQQSSVPAIGPKER